MTSSVNPVQLPKPRRAKLQPLRALMGLALLGYVLFLAFPLERQP